MMPNQNPTPVATLPAVSPRALQLIQTLVQMNTVSHHSNLALIHFVRDELHKLGVASRITTNHDNTKANLFATLGEVAGLLALRLAARRCSAALKCGTPRPSRLGLGRCSPRLSRRARFVRHVHRGK